MMRLPGSTLGARAARSLVPTALAALAIVGCDAGTTPMEVEAPDAPEPIEQSAAAPQLALAPTPIPIPPGLVGCQEPFVEESTGASHQICWPVAWNGGFVIYAHGYETPLPPGSPPLPGSIANEAVELAAFTGSLGFAFASTGYRTRGLAVEKGPDDMLLLAEDVRAAATALGVPGESVPVLVAGASEGGLITTLAAERYRHALQGALSTCGPTGDFQEQLDYIGDFNVLFNYFFPDVFQDPTGPGFLVTPAGVDPQVWTALDFYVARATQAVLADPAAALELVKVAQVAVDVNDPASVQAGIAGVLRYNLVGTEDAKEKLGGSPYSNTHRWYRGSGQDLHLNRNVQRFSGDANARAKVRNRYETSGRLRMPYVSLHTINDEIVPFWQQDRYGLKASANHRGWRHHSALPVARYGHCNFEDSDLTLGLALLLAKVGGATPAAAQAALPSDQSRARFKELLPEVIRYPDDQM